VCNFIIFNWLEILQIEREEEINRKKKTLGIKKKNYLGWEIWKFIKPTNVHHTYSTTNYL